MFSQTNESNFNTTEQIKQAILNYSQLKPANKEGKRECPNCGQVGFSFNKTHPFKYDCYKCNDRQGIFKSLMGSHKEVKSTRPKQTREWVYKDRQGNLLIKVVRIDDGNGKRTFYQHHWNGKQWIKGYGEVKREDIPIYRYQEVREAIARGETIFIVEGEPIADLLWKMGIPATCNVGGSGKWLSSHSKDLEGASVVICPDRDKKGIEHAETIGNDFPNALWLYACPSSPFWKPEHIQDNGGLDLVDWINDDGATKEMILSAIEDKKRDFSLSPKVVNHPKYNPLPSNEIISLLNELIDENLSDSNVTARLIELSQKTGIITNTLKTIYDQLLEEKQKDDDFNFEQLESLIKLQNIPFKISDYLPLQLSEPIIKISEILGSEPLAFLTALFPVMASLTNPDTTLTLIQSTNFKARPIMYAGLVGESGGAKSPTLKTILDPLRKLQAFEDKRYEEALEQYNKDLLAYKKDKSGDIEPPIEPNPREYFINDATSEAIALIQSKQSDNGLLLEMDELSGLVKSQNAYRGGKGADAERILSGRDGTGIKVNRASGKRLSNPRSTLSILGGIQPDTLQQQMGDQRDSQGYWARFLWCNLPVKSAKFPEDDFNSNIIESLGWLYSEIIRLPAIDYQLSPNAKQAYKKWFETLEDKRKDEPNQALRSVYSKFKQFTGDLALLLQIIKSAIDNRNGMTPETEISENIMRKAIKLSKIYIGQTKLIYANNNASFDELAPVYLKILDLANKKGSLTAREAQRGIYLLKKQPSNKILGLFKDLESKGYGVVKKIGKKVCFEVSPTQKIGDSIGDTSEPIDITSFQDSMENNHNQVSPNVSPKLSPITQLDESYISQEFQGIKNEVSPIVTYFDELENENTQTNEIKDIWDDSLSNENTHIKKETVTIGDNNPKTLLGKEVTIGDSLKNGVTVGDSSRQFKDGDRIEAEFDSDLHGIETVTGTIKNGVFKSDNGLTASLSMLINPRLATDKKWFEVS